MSVIRQPLGQKMKPFISRELRQSARGQMCALRLACCNHDPETTVLAHLRYFGWAGVAQKPHDFLAIFACSACHAEADRRGAVEFEDILRALGETLTAHFEAGRMVAK